MKEDLLGSYVRLVHNQDERSAGFLVADAVSLALSPFRPGRVTIWMEDTFVDGYKIQVNAENLVDDDFVALVTREALGHYIESVGIYIAEQVFKHYRNLPLLEVPDNIILGAD